MNRSEGSRAIISYAESGELTSKLMSCLRHMQQGHLVPFPYEHLHLSNPEGLRALKTVHAQRCLAIIESSVDDFEAIHSGIVENLPNCSEFQTILIANSGHNYFDVAQRYNIGNLLREDNFDAGMLSAIVKRLLGNNFFGFSPFFPEGYPMFHKSYVLSGLIHTSAIAGRYFTDFLNRLPEEEKPYFASYCAELVTNAMTYGVIEVSEEDRDSNPDLLPEVVKIPDDKAITVTIVEDHEKYGFSILDTKGSLSASRILQKIRRHTAIDGELLPPGLEDDSGRGFFIMSSSNRLVVNILKDKKTEVILMHFFDQNKNHYQPLIINEREFGEDDA